MEDLGELKTIASILTSNFKKIDSLSFKKPVIGGVPGIPVNFCDFDAMTQGLQPGDLMILGGRPAMVKTTFGLGIVAIGVLYPYLKNLGLGQLPGDIVLRGENSIFYFPILSCIVVSFVILVIFNLLSTHR